MERQARQQAHHDHESVVVRSLPGDFHLHAFGEVLPDLDRHRTEPIERQGGSHEEEDKGGTAEGDEPALFPIRERRADETGGLVKEDRGSDGHADAEAGVHEDFPDAHEGELLELSHVDQPFSRLA